MDTGESQPGDMTATDTLEAKVNGAEKPLYESKCLPPSDHTCEKYQQHTCKKCQERVSLAGDRCPTPGCGAALPGNRLTLGSGARSARSGAELFPEAAIVLREREAAIIADLGGAANVSTARAELVTRFVQASAIADSLGEQIVRGGVTSAKGRPRAVVSLYLAVLDRIVRLGTSIGLERQPRGPLNVRDLSPEEYIAAQQREGGPQ